MSSSRPIRAARSGGRHARLDADPARRAQAVRDRLAVEQPAVATGRLQRVPQRVPEVQGDPAAAGVALALVRQHDLHLRPRAALDDLGDGARRERRLIAPRDRRAVLLEELEQPLVAERGHLDRLAERGPALALGSVRRPRRR